MQIVKSICPVTKRPISLRLITPTERQAEIEQDRRKAARPDSIFMHPILRKLDLTEHEIREMLARHNSRRLLHRMEAAA